MTLVEDHKRVIAWATRSGDDVYLGMLSDFEHLAKSARETNVALAASTWDELVDVFGRQGVEYELGEFLDQAWEECEHDTDAARPDDWLPEDVPELAGDWLTYRPRYDDPDQLSLPKEFMELGRHQSSMMSGDFVCWDRSDLPRLERLAALLGFQFIERQDLVVHI